MINTKLFEGHTPGPLKVIPGDFPKTNHGYLVFQQDKREVLASIEGLGGQYAANANLYAASPELLRQRNLLLEAAKRLANAFDDAVPIFWDGSTIQVVRPDISGLRTAIAECEGK